MNRVAAFFASVWRSRLLTLTVLGLYVAYALRGVHVGAVAARDRRHEIPVRMHLLTKSNLKVDLEGRARRVSLLQDEREAVLVGSSTLHIDATLDTAASIHVAVEFESAIPGDFLAFEERGGSRRLRLDHVWEWRNQANLPLDRTPTLVELRASRPDLRYRVRKFHLEANSGLAAAQAGVDSGPVSRHRDFVMGIGTGWWERSPEHVGKPFAPREQMFTRRLAYLLFEPTRVGRHRVVLLMRPASPHHALPALLFDLEPVQPKVEPYESFGDPSGPGTLRITFEVEVTRHSVLALVMRDALQTPEEVGLSARGRRGLGWVLYPAHVEMTPIDR